MAGACYNPFSLIIKALKARLESAAKDGAAWAARSSDAESPPSRSWKWPTTSWKALVDTNDEWISTRTGIRSRHVAVEETATDLAEAAARQALGLADGGWREDGEAIDPASIDLVIYATITPDVLVPSAAGPPRRRLGLETPLRST